VTAETQPELVAHHYTAAGFTEQAIFYWQQAGQRALQHSANPEAIRHLTRGLELLTMRPDTPARVQQELELQVALGPALMATRGQAAPEVDQTYARARALCAQVGETPQLFPTLWGLCRFYQSRGPLPTARRLGEQLYRLAQREAAPTPRLEAHDALGTTLFLLGKYPAARMHLEQGVALTDPGCSGPWCSAMAWRLECGALAWRRTRCGVWATRRRPCTGVKRRKPWRRRWPITRVWSMPSTMRPSCITAAASRQPCRRRPTPV
jgi:hypothetical protein